MQKINLSVFKTAFTFQVRRILNQFLSKIHFKQKIYQKRAIPMPKHLT
jgi:hypothetical protein